MRRTLLLLWVMAGCDDATQPVTDDVIQIVDMRPTDLSFTDAQPADMGGSDCPMPRDWSPLADCPPNQRVGVDGCVDRRPCPGAWVDLAPGCGPPPPADCPSGQFVLGDGACSAPWPCPEGWQRDGSSPGCVPGPGTCAFGDCAPWDAPPCADPPDDALIVDPAASQGGDGSADRPFAALDDALAVAGAGQLIHLSPGIYAADVEVPAGVQLVGACTDTVRIDGAVRLLDGTALRRVTVIQVLVAGRGVELEDLQVMNSAEFGVTVRPRAEVRAARVRVAHAADGGLMIATSGRARFERLVITDTSWGGLVEGEAEFVAAHVIGGSLAVCGRATLRDVRIEDAPTVALLVWKACDEGHPAVWAETLVISGVTTAENARGPALHVQEGGRAEVTDAVFEGTRGHSVRAFSDDTILQLTRTVVRGPRPVEESSRTGFVAAGATIELNQAALEGGRSAGLVVADSARLEARDVWIGPAPAAGVGIGLSVSGDAQIDGLHLSGRRSAGVHVFGAGARLGLHRARVHATTRGPPAAGGRGVEVGAGAHLQAHDLTITDAFDLGLLLDSEATGEVTRLHVARAGALGTSLSGGLLVQNASLELRHALVEDGLEMGVVLLESSTLDATAVTIRGIRPRPDADANDINGAGLLNQHGQLSAKGLTLTDNRHAGVVGNGGTSTGSDWIVRGTGLFQDGRGFGVLMLQEASLSLDGVELSDNHGVGLRIGLDARGTVSDLVARRTRQRPDTGASGDGVGVDEGGTLDLSRARIVDNALGAVYVNDATLSLRDALIGGGRSGARPAPGIWAQANATVRLEEVAVVETGEIGVYAVDGARIEGRGLGVRRVETVDGDFGLGLAAQDLGEVDLTCVQIDDAHSAGVLVSDATASLSHLHVRGTHAAPPNAGAGVWIEGAGSTTLTDFSVRDNAGSGVTVVDGAPHLERGSITGHGIGLRCGPEAAPAEVALDFIDNETDRMKDANMPQSGRFEPSRPFKPE